MLDNCNNWLLVAYIRFILYFLKHLFIYGNKDWTQGLRHAKHEFYYTSDPYAVLFVAILEYSPSTY